DISNLTYTAPTTDPDVGTSFGFTVSDGNLSSNPQVFSVDVRGNLSNSVMSGGSDDEIVDGSHQADTLRGEGGSDTLLGDAGADIIFGGTGSDIITGDDDQPVPVNVSASFISASSQASIVVDVASGVSLSAGTDNGDGTWTLSGEDLPGLTMSGTGNSWDESLTFTATGPVTRNVVINDHSFESQSLTTDGAFVHQPTSSSWTFSGANDGIHNYNNNGLNEPATEGINAGFLNTDGTISQTLVENFDRSISYQLQVDIGNRSNEGFADYEVRIKAGGVVLASDGSVTPAEGEFDTLTLNLNGAA
ncbi:calcium-binding protein, partial [Endozoicomonas arenosclerae]|uniref:calcium-binding protein n=1 Tax=Endozoicomonas arenosclerae TaxID=1633495 RepID=UPI000AF80F5F